MINEEKVALMTKLAFYEKHRGKKARKVNEYFRGDYVVVQMLKSVIAATLIYGIVFGLYIFMDFETFMQNIYKMDLIAFARNVITYYVIFLACYVAFTFVHAMAHYYLAQRSLRRYYQDLKKLNAFYKNQK
ncbi:MAG: hypothetical protein J6Z22_10785 [Lachnospiraceae bacterium]|nr:hypothetical protein [Lachnospiraceae bacterium]